MTEKRHYVACIDLDDRSVLVVGAGRVAHEKVRGLLDCGAAVTVVAPEVSPEVAALPVEVLRRPYRRSDLDGRYLVVAATDDPAVNTAVFADAEARSLLCNVVDVPELCSLHPPGAAPPGSDHGLGVDRRRLARARAAAPRRDRPDRGAGACGAGSAAARAAPLGEAAPARPTKPGATTSPASSGTSSDDRPPRRRRARRSWPDHSPRPRARPFLRRRSSTTGSSLPSSSRRRPPDALVLCRDGLDQAAVTELLVDSGRSGLDVVRLKGGDPFVFGRGGEEALALQAAGIACEIVPGVSSIAAVPAAAGIPVTHRGISDHVTIASCQGADGGEADYARLAAIGGTLVLFMGLGRVERVVDGLLAAGMPPETPAAAISRGTLPDQEVVRTTLQQLAGAATGLAGRR